jgi:hypothetical protein
VLYLRWPNDCDATTNRLTRTEAPRPRHYFTSNYLDPYAADIHIASNLLRQMTARLNTVKWGCSATSPLEGGSRYDASIEMAALHATLTLSPPSRNRVQLTRSPRSWASLSESSRPACRASA